MIELKKRLINNPEKIKKILIEYGFCNVKIGTSEVRCAFDEDGNATSIRVKLNENLTTNDFTRDIHGDLFSYIVKSKQVLLKDIIRTVKAELGITYIEFNKTKKIFGGFYDNIKLRNKAVYEMKRYDEYIMDSYLNKYNTLFLRDNISLETQKKFKVGIDHATSRITVPWYDSEGELIGIEGRYLGDYEKDEVPKWFPILPFSKSQVLFGYHVNYEHLQGCDDIYVGESSKFCMQLDSYGIHQSVALGGSAIHTQQIKQLSWLNPKRIILCLDEGLGEDYILKQVNKLNVLLKFSGIKVGYIFDDKNEIMRQGSKCSPSDLGIDEFNKLINNYVKWG